MKTLITTLTLLLLASQAQAVVADKFRCELEIKLGATNVSTKQEQEFFVARLPSSGGTDIQRTMGQANSSLELKGLASPVTSMKANLNFYYEHATRVGADGQLEARQAACIAVSAGICRDTPTPGFALCSDEVLRCQFPGEPFDQGGYWSPVRVINGIPEFTVRNQTDIEVPVTDAYSNEIGLLKVSCKHLGTFN